MVVSCDTEVDTHDRGDRRRHNRLSYDLSATLAEIRPGYTFNETCQGSVPQSVIAFLESGSYEDAVRKAISLGGDSDTIACITGGIAQAYYKTVPENIIKESKNRLDKTLLAVVDRFNARYVHPYKIN